MKHWSLQVESEWRGRPKSLSISAPPSPPVSVGTWHCWNTRLSFTTLRPHGLQGKPSPAHDRGCHPVHLDLLRYWLLAKPKQTRAGGTAELAPYWHSDVGGGRCCRMGNSRRGEELLKGFHPLFISSLFSDHPKWADYLHNPYEVHLMFRADSASLLWLLCL